MWACPVYDRLRGRTYNNLLIDVGGPIDERFLGHGWAAREQNPDFFVSVGRQRDLNRARAPQNERG